MPLATPMPKLSALVCCCLLLTLLAPLHSAPAPATYAQAEVPVPIASPGARPRLLITQGYINQTLIPRMENNGPTWQAFARYVNTDQPEADTAWTPGTVVRSLALAWLVTGDVTYADRGLQAMISLVSRIQSDPVMQGEGGFSGTFLDDVAALAVGYDWLYDALRPVDREALEAVMLDATRQLLNPDLDIDEAVWVDGQLSAFDNYGARWLWAITAVGLARLGDNENAPSILALARDALTSTIIPGLDAQSGGAWSEGPVYGFWANWANTQTALAWWTARGENYFGATDWWYDRLAYDLFLYYPTTIRTGNQPTGNLIHHYPSVFGDSQRYQPAAAYGRAQDLMLRTVYAGSLHASWMDWFVRQPPDFMPGWLAVEEFLWRDPNSPGTPPTDLTWIASDTGHVFMRSNWADASGQLDPTATYVSFNAGDHLSFHQFFDQGNFTLFHNGTDLVARSGVYSGSGTSDHDANYYARTIAGNTILVCDLIEDFDGIRPNSERNVWLNDCGQRTTSPARPSAVNREGLVENWRVFDTATITRLAENGSITYLRADLTGAYNSTVYTTPENRAKVSTVIRELVYLRPGTLIVYDRVITTYPSYTPLIVFHFPAAPQATGAFFEVRAGDSVLYLQNLLPNSRTQDVEGYVVAGEVVEKSWGVPASNDFESELYAPYRLEITPDGPATYHWFMTLLTAQNASAPPPTRGILLLTDNMRGVAFGETQIMFDLAPGDDRDITQARFDISPGVEYTLVSGLVPGADYLVTGSANLSR
ncbi:MAG: hypothetical protein GYB65_07730, partial [Chloroflexi bacterium]|nr:hypothetical protein [Chloroflexota bacterium]